MVCKTNPCLKSLCAKWGTASGGRGVGSTGVPLKDQKLPRTKILISWLRAVLWLLRHASFPPAMLSISSFCLSVRMLELPGLEGQTACSSVTAPWRVLGLTLSTCSSSIPAGRCCSGSTARRWEGCGVCPSLLQATTSPNPPPNPIKLLSWECSGFCFSCYSFWEAVPELCFSGWKPFNASHG